MSSFPLVGTAIRVYEHGKASSRVVKVHLLVFLVVNTSEWRMQYGAEMVESSVKTISKPVINRLPVNQIDDFACRQLDKVSSSPFFTILFKIAIRACTGFIWPFILSSPKSVFFRT